MRGRGILIDNIIMTHDDDGTHSIKSMCAHTHAHTAHAETTGIEADHWQPS